jgi:hypothetical protein
LPACHERGGSTVASIASVAPAAPMGLAFDSVDW